MYYHNLVIYERILIVTFTTNLTALRECKERKNWRIAIALIDEWGGGNPGDVRKWVVSAAVEVDQVKHVEQRPADPDQERWRHNHVQTVEQFPKR